APARKPGELPGVGLGEWVGDFGAKVFSNKDRVRQRKLASYFVRLADALDDQFELDGFGALVDVAEAIQLVLGKDKAVELADRIGPAAWNSLEVARLLGYDPEA